LLQKIELASAALFDLGIFVVVIATVVLVLTELGLLSRREVVTPSAPATARAI
jgi:multisubunit Na+/H+ antiporter MnhB subunit